MSTTDRRRPLTLSAVASKHPGWLITPSTSIPGYLADRHLSPTATRTIAGRDLADLDERLSGAEDGE